MAIVRMALLKKLPAKYHSPAGMRHLKKKKKQKQVDKVTSYNYYGGANQRRKTADELLKEIKMGKR